MGAPGAGVHTHENSEMGTCHSVHMYCMFTSCIKKQI